MEIEEEFISGFCPPLHVLQNPEINSSSISILFLLNFPYISLSFRETKIQATIYSLLFTNIFIYSSVFCCILQQTDL